MYNVLIIPGDYSKIYSLCDEDLKTLAEAEFLANAFTFSGWIDAKPICKTLNYKGGDSKTEYINLK